MKLILYPPILIGDKILHIEELIKYLELKHKSKDYKCYKDKIEN